MFVEQDDVVSRLETAKDEFPFTLFLLTLAESLGVFHLRDDLQSKRNVVPDAVYILVCYRFEAFVGSFSDHDEHAFHSFPSSVVGLTNS